MLIATVFQRLVSSMPLSKQYKFVKNAISQDRFALESSDLCISPYKTPYPRSKEWCTFIYFVNKHIILDLPEFYLRHKTLGVRKRIATSLLNKIKNVPESDKMLIHKYLIDNLDKELFEIEYGDLPF